MGRADTGQLLAPAAAQATCPYSGSSPVRTWLVCKVMSAALGSLVHSQTKLLLLRGGGGGGGQLSVPLKQTSLAVVGTCIECI